jgi:iron complex transport system substrate-binding protein
MRVIAHTCSNTEIVCALGCAHLLVGVDDHSDYPPEVVNTLPRIGPDLDIDIDRVRALKPDLVITSLTVPGHERCLQRLQAAGLPHLVTAPTSLAGVAADIRRIGAALGVEAAAEHWASQFDAALATPTPDPTQAVPVVIEWWPKPVIVPGRRSWVNEMLALAGGRNPWSAVDAESLEISPEQAREAAPECIVMSWCGVQEDKYRRHVVRRRPGWADVPAIVNDRIVPISEAWLGRPGPRLLQGIERLRAMLTQQ